MLETTPKAIDKTLAGLPDDFPESLALSISDGFRRRLESEGVINSMSAIRQKPSSQADPQLLAELKAIAEAEGRQFQAVLEQAMRVQ